VLKPNPDPIFLCLERLGCNFRDCLYVGDSPMDVMAGKAAGTKTVAVLTGVGTVDDLAKVGPDFILNSVKDLPALFGIGRS
jgi:pyrophosphatase PpaX